MAQVTRMIGTAALVAALTALIPATAGAQDRLRPSIPGRWIEPLVPEDLPALEHPSYYGALDEARAQVRAGRYRLALATLHRAERPGSEAVDPVAVALVRAEAQAALGRWEQALKTLEPPAVAERPEAQVLHACVLAEMGSLDEAVDALKVHLSQHPDSIAGRYHLGRIHERRGDLDSARQAYEWFAVEQRFLDRWQGQREPLFEDAQTVTLIGRALDRHAALSGAYQRDVKLHNALLEVFVQAYDVIDRGYGPAHTAAAEFFMWHDDTPKATAELEAALEANPNDAEALRLAVMLALEVYDFDRAESAIAALRDSSPQSSVLWRLEARNLLRQRLPREAERPLRKALERNPRDIEAMGLLAAAQALQLRDQEADKLLAQVDAVDVGSDDATALYEVAEHLSALRQYPRSAAMYQRAIARAPWWPAPRNGLGLLYTQSGEEDLARTTLEQARLLDPFNLATTNYLRLLDDLAKFDRAETEHFVIFFDQRTDPLIGEAFGTYLESIYPQVTGAFAHEPAVKTYIEVFPTHDGFSVRTTGSPWIGTVGASTGRVIAMVAPRKGQQTMGPYHWAMVLRHEFTHTVTLSATDNRIPHWMTEGLAVLEEHAPLKWDWAPMLYQATTKDELFPLADLTWGFVRPRRPNDRALAYAQSYWICLYIDQTFGRESILKMMQAFREGRSEAAVFQEVLGRSMSQFSQEFQAWARRQVEGWGFDTETTARYEELRKQAEQFIQARQFEQALPLWEQIASLRPMDPLPHQRLAGLYLRLERPKDAVEHLVALHRAELKDNRYAKRAARIHRDLGQIADATGLAQEAVYIEPFDIDAHTLLAELHEAAGDQARADEERRAVELLEARGALPPAQ